MNHTPIPLDTSEIVDVSIEPENTFFLSDTPSFEIEIPKSRMGATSSMTQLLMRCGP
jgi:hypothetical protein